VTITWFPPTATPAEDLEARVAAALESDATSAADLHGLIAEVSAALSDTRERSLRAAERARDFRLSRDDAQAALDDEAALLFTATRYESAAKALQTAHQAAQRRETAARRRTEQEALTAARAAIVAEAAERIPELSFLLAHLCTRIKAVDAKIAEFNRTARGDAVAPTGLADFLAVLKLPSWDQPAHRSIWPSAQQAGAVVPLGMQRHAAELGHEARKTGDVVSRRRAVEAAGPTRKVS
jgi:hypothetical protein